MKRTPRRPSLAWLFACPPYALFLLWRGEYRWKLPAKALISAAYLALVLTILLWPSPDRAKGTKVVLVGAKPSAEVFGPELPRSYDASEYHIENDDDAIVPASATAENTLYVYASGTEGSTYYHLSTCKYAYASSRRMTLYEARMLGYVTPCGVCKPPVYDPNAN